MRMILVAGATVLILIGLSVWAFWGDAAPADDSRTQEGPKEGSEAMGGGNGPLTVQDADLSGGDDSATLLLDVPPDADSVMLEVTLRPSAAEDPSVILSASVDLGGEPVRIGTFSFFPPLSVGREETLILEVPLDRLDLSDGGPLPIRLHLDPADPGGTVDGVELSIVRTRILPTE